MKTNLLALLVLVLCATGCTREGAILRREERLIGAWEIDRVTYKRDFALFAENITDEYAGDVMEFYSDYSAAYDDSSLGAVFFGSWYLLYEEDSYWSEDGDVSDLDWHLDANFYDDVANEEFFFFGDINRLTQNRLNFEMLDARGEFRFRLRKI